MERGRRVFWGVAGAFALGLLLGSGVRADDVMSVAGVISASEHEADEGYFAIGAETMIAVKPQSPLHQWLRTRGGQQARLTISVGAGTD